MSYDDGTFHGDVYGLNYPGRYQEPASEPASEPAETAAAEAAQADPVLVPCTCQCHRLGMRMRHTSPCCRVGFRVDST